MDIEIKTIPQAPVTTIMKTQIPFYNKVNEKKHYGMEVVFIECEIGRKWVHIVATYKIINGDMPYIYEETMKVKRYIDYCKITNSSPLYNLLRPTLVHDGLMNEFDNGAILITPRDLKRYLPHKCFSVQGRNMTNYKNAVVYEPKED